MDAKKRNILLICAAIFIGSYVARSFVTAYLRMLYARQQAMQQRQKSKPKPSAETAQADAPSLANLSGFWQGHAYLPGRGTCNLRLELRRNDSEHYSGYSRFGCLNPEALTNPSPATMMKYALPNTNPDSTIFTGTVEKGEIRLHADKNVGSDGCAISDLTITPFGTNQVVAEWKETTCQGGNLILQEASHRAAPLPRRYRYPEDTQLHPDGRHSAKDGLAP